MYLDYAATTPIDERVLQKMNTISKSRIGNASSAHSYGRESARVLDEAREDVANFLDAQFNEIFFTSGATEANNIAIVGVLKKFNEVHPERKMHIVTSTIEHSSVLNVFKEIEKMGVAEVTWIGVNESGIIDYNDVKNAIIENTCLVSIQYVNNEIGTIQPVRKIGKIIKKVNERREREFRNKKSAGEKELRFTAYDKLYFHTDAVQSANYINLDVRHMHVDLLTFSAHKIYGPKGVGVLFVREGVPIKNITFGGDQELSLRPGTYNIAGIAGLAEACKIIAKGIEVEADRVIKLRDYTIEKLLHMRSNIYINGDLERRIANNINFSVNGVSGETLLLKLDQAGIAVSAGSACASVATDPSHVLLAMGLNNDRVNSSIRVSIGRDVTKANIEIFLLEIDRILQ